MAIGENSPVADKILEDIKETLQGTAKRAGTDFFHAPRLVTRAPGVSPKWFENPEWEVAYWIVAPEERSKELTTHQYESTLEVFIVGAKAGRWSLVPWEQKPPTREQVQQRVAHDIKKAIIEDFRRGCLAINTELSSTKFAFSAWPNFAIVSTRWEVTYIWQKGEP